MEDITHILGRAILHMFSFAGIYLAAYFSIKVARAKAPHWTDKIIPALLIIGFIGWNEVGDIINGQSYVKAFTDLASWILGAVVSIWGLEKFEKAGKAGSK